MNRSKLARAFLLSSLLVLSVALVSCVPEGDDDDDDDEDSRIPAVHYLA